MIKKKLPFSLKHMQGHFVYSDDAYSTDQRITSQKTSHGYFLHIDILLYI